MFKRPVLNICRIPRSTKRSNVLQLNRSVSSDIFVRVQTIFTSFFNLPLILKCVAQLSYVIYTNSLNCSSIFGTVIRDRTLQSFHLSDVVQINTLQNFFVVSFHLLTLETNLNVMTSKHFQIWVFLYSWKLIGYKQNEAFLLVMGIGHIFKIDDRYTNID